jgi:AraC-like DNA-binding protein
MLSQVTDELRLRNLHQGIARVAPPWGYTVTVPGMHAFLVTRGTVCLTWIQDVDFTPVVAHPGDVLLLPHGRPYRVQDDLRTLASLQKFPERVAGHSRRGGDTSTEFIGLVFQFDSPHSSLLTDFLPEVMHLPSDTQGLKRWLKPTIELFHGENETESLGQASILRRIAEIVCIQAIRIWLDQLPSASRGWLRGLKDEQLAKALQMIHAKPDMRWTVELLAREACLSRTVFATRFKALVGESPMKYLCRWRMYRAVTLLEQQHVTLKALVQASGYKSSSTFRTNFKHKYGMMPSEYRCQLRHANNSISNPNGDGPVRHVD